MVSECVPKSTEPEIIHTITTGTSDRRMKTSSTWSLSRLFWKEKIEFISACMCIQNTLLFWDIPITDLTHSQFLVVENAINTIIFDKKR